jgi:hypothetical protein
MPNYVYKINYTGTIINRHITHKKGAKRLGYGLDDLGLESRQQQETDLPGKTFIPVLNSLLFNG